MCILNIIQYGVSFMGLAFLLNPNMKYCVEEIKNGCPCIVEIRDMGLVLGRRPCTSHRGIGRRSQRTTLSASDLHNAWATILIPFNNL